MPIELPLSTMSEAEKVQLIETIWDSLSARPADVQSPDWHADILAERRDRLTKGVATVSSWDEAKARFLNVGK